MTSSTVAAAIAPVASANLVIAVARFATSIDAAQLDGAVIQAVKTNMLDTLSCALAGSSAPGAGRRRCKDEATAGRAPSRRQALSSAPTFSSSPLG